MSSETWVKGTEEQFPFSAFQTFNNKARRKYCGGLKLSSNRLGPFHSHRTMSQSGIEPCTSRGIADMRFDFDLRQISVIEA